MTPDTLESLRAERDAALRREQALRAALECSHCACDLCIGVAVEKDTPACPRAAALAATPADPRLRAVRLPEAGEYGEWRSEGVGTVFTNGDGTVWSDTLYEPVQPVEARALALALLAAAEAAEGEEGP